MADKKSRDYNTKLAVRHIKSLTSNSDIDSFLSDDEDRSTIIKAVEKQKESLSNTSKPTGIESNSKRNPEDVKPFSELTTICRRQSWQKRELVRTVKEIYSGFEVDVEEYNARQIAFTIEGTRIPEEGHFSVK